MSRLARWVQARSMVSWTQVLGAAAITAGQRGGQSQQGRAVLGVQDAERHVRAGSGNRDGLITGHDALPSAYPR